MLESVVYHNTLQSWLYAAATAVLVYAAARLLIRLLLRRVGATAAETPSGWDDLLVESLERVQRLFLLILAVYVAALPLELPAPAAEVIHKAFFLALLIQFGLLGSHALQATFERYRRQALERNAAAVTTLSSVAFLLRMLLWVILALIALDNFGADVTTLIAGLGVGGIAVALAVQNILGDLFASFSIVFDKPFVIGDFVIVGDYLGTVEHIGLKTTRLRSLGGEQLVFSNTDLLGSRIRNYKRMYERRVVFSFGVVYQTPVAKLRAIPGMIREIVAALPQARLDRAHFARYGAYSLDFEVVYYVDSPDYNVYMDIQQAINLAIFERFAADGIDFAYPTQLLYVNREAA